MNIQMDLLLRIIFTLSTFKHITAQSWMKKSNVMAWQLNPQLYLLGAAPKCTAAKAKLSPLQNAMCTNGGYMDHMSSVNVGLILALSECQHQFSTNKWNCTEVEMESMLEGITDVEASKEDAFIHAVTAAGIAHAVSRGCRNGLITKCSCSEMTRPSDLDNDWVWGGCGDNVEYGYRFASVFVDLREKESNHPKASEELAVMLMNKHNNEAGRRTVDKQDTVVCKCHGVSGACTIKTCWQALAPFRTIGDKLKQNYDGAMQVAFNKDGTGLRNTVRSKRSKRRASKEELIYLKSSPNLCQKKDGMVGRQCNSTTDGGADHCDDLCCGRGYETRLVTVTERCRCSFQWCCYVQCEQCEKQVYQSFCK